MENTKSLYLESVAENNFSQEIILDLSIKFPQLMII
jgi:hypothetical protein